MKKTRPGDDRTASTTRSNSLDSSKEVPEEGTYNGVGNLLSYVTSCGAQDTTSSESSFLHCGGSHPFRSMQRASVARRFDPASPGATGVRPRSSERTIMAPENEELKGASGHCRSMSDPFDTAQFEDAISPAATTDEEEDEYYAASMSQLSISSEHGAALPTFQRFPCGESRNKNCWSEPPIAIFSIRGANYFTDKVKVPSSPYLLPARGSDVFLTDSKKPFCISQMYVVSKESVELWC
jgi:Protein ENHANCED DISEASE RESISTANCE 2, C-terminal